MIGAGTVINPIIKVLSTLVLIAAVSIFVIKPVLSSTEHITRSERDRQAQQQREQDLYQRQNQLRVARTVALAQASSARIAGDFDRARRIVKCVRRGTKARDPDKIDFCQAK